MTQEFVHDVSDAKDAYKLLMAYDGSGRRISKTRMVKDDQRGYWYTDHVTHYTGIGTEVREVMRRSASPKTDVVVNMPQGLGRYGVEDAADPFKGIDKEKLAGYIPSTKFEWYLKNHQGESSENDLDHFHCRAAGFYATRLNHLGSTMLVYGTSAYDDSYFSGYKGGVQAAYDYRAFGEQVDLEQKGDKVTENFTGKELDDETELNYFGARYLDPMLGLWTSVDPKRQFASPYLYAGNFANPINGYDPDGLTWEYAQNTGRLTHIDDETGVRSFVAYGYAGHGGGFNNSNYESVVKTGPLPVGKYTISPMIEKHPGGKYSNYMTLKPDESNEMYGRSAFLIHGRKTLDDYDASSGCMIFDIAERQRIADSKDNRLNVVSDALEDLQDGPGNVYVNPHEIEVEQE